MLWIRQLDSAEKVDSTRSRPNKEEGYGKQTSHSIKIKGVLKNLLMSLQRF